MRKFANTRRVKKFKKPMLILLLPIGALLFYSASLAPNFIERFYSNGVYKLISQGFSLINGLFPVSLAEIGFIALILITSWSIIRTIVRMVKEKNGKLSILMRFLLNVFIVISIIYFSFVALWGLNYSRQPFSKIASLDVRPSSVSELSGLCENLIERANQLRNHVQENSSGVMIIPGSSSDIFKRASKGYENAAKTYPELSGRYSAPKGIIFSKIMSYSGISGIFSPFTGEANVDTDIPDSQLPSTACHEMAHQRGFSREDEANYIAYLTCTAHPDVDFQYSGIFLALVNSMNALYDHDGDKYNLLRKNYSRGVLEDLRFNSAYWKQYEGPVNNVTSSLNDAYLKANMQKDGIQSYGRMVDLLLADYRKNGGKMSR